MSSVVVSFEQQLAAVVRLGNITWDVHAERFEFRPSTNESYKIFALRKGWVKFNADLVELVKGLFGYIVSTEQRKTLKECVDR